MSNIRLTEKIIMGTTLITLSFLEIFSSIQVIEAFTKNKFNHFCEDNANQETCSLYSNADNGMTDLSKSIQMTMPTVYLFSLITPGLYFYLSILRDAINTSDDKEPEFFSDLKNTKTATGKNLMMSMFWVFLPAFIPLFEISSFIALPFAKKTSLSVCPSATDCSDNSIGANNTQINSINQFLNETQAENIVIGLTFTFIASFILSSLYTVILTTIQKHSNHNSCLFPEPKGEKTEIDLESQRDYGTMQFKINTEVYI